MKLTVCLFFAVWVAFLQQLEVSAQDNCLFSRLDVLPCNFVNPNIPQPEENELGIYSTRIRPDSQGNPSCIVRRRGSVVRDIDTASSVKLLYSPGIELFPQMSYLNEMLVQYNIQCNANETAFVGIMSQDIEPQNCFDSTTESLRCRDYVEIDGGSSGTVESCGDSPDSALLIPSGTPIRVRMRTSVAGRFPGFAAYVICFAEAAPVSKRSGRPADKCTMVPPRKVAAGSPLDVKAREAPSVTADELAVVEELVSSLLENAYINARRKCRKWPPRGFLEDDKPRRPWPYWPYKPHHPVPTVQPVHPTPWPYHMPYQQGHYVRPKRHGQPAYQPWPVYHGRRRFRCPQYRPRQYRQRTLRSGLRKDLACTARRFEEACSPILQATTQSYLQLFKRLHPKLLERLKCEVPQPKGYYNHGSVHRNPNGLYG